MKANLDFQETGSCTNGIFININCPAYKNTEHDLKHIKYTPMWLGPKKGFSWVTEAHTQLSIFAWDLGSKALSTGRPLHILM